MVYGYSQQKISIMQPNIFQLLASFRSLFSRQAAFSWFIVVIFGFLLRFDHYGVSSFVRWFAFTRVNLSAAIEFLAHEANCVTPHKILRNYIHRYRCLH